MMKKFLLLNLVLGLMISSVAFAAELVVVGKIPTRYLETNSKSKALVGYVHIKNKVIQDVAALSLKKIQSKFAGKTIIVAKTGNKYDYLYPGMTDLHNHTKQNNLSVWGQAKGQFKNRFEWRAWSNYKYSVSGNMNPWIGYSKPVVCAAFRWSELQAMVLGTTYLQGPSNCIKDYAIHQVEDNRSYISNRDRVQAPTDLVIPNDMTFVWQELRPLIKAGKTYGEALAQKINEHCDIDGIDGESVFSSDKLSFFKDQDKLRAACTKGSKHPKFIRYVYWIHSSIAGKLAYMKENNGAIIAHMAEGRRDDPYNQKEFEVAMMLGFVGPHINYVHGVGIKKEHLKIMGKNGMGLIWSPFSNFLLYGQTLDIKAAQEAGVIMSLGSDWLPTGTRGILEEAKIAAKYIDEDPNKEGLKKIFTDEVLYEMLTENPAKMINHWEIDEAKKEHGIGRLVKGAMGTLIAVSANSSDPYTNLVRKAYAQDLNLVVIDGEPLYGSEKNIQQAGIATYETMPKYFKGINELANDESVPTIPEKGSSKKVKNDHLVALGKFIKSKPLESFDNCGFKTKKAFVHQDSFNANKTGKLGDYQKKTGLNLDRFEDLHKLLAVSMLTQSRNRNNPSKGKRDFRVLEFPSLYSCNEQAYIDRVFSFVKPDANDDEFEVNRVPSTVDSLREEQSLGRVPEKLAKEYAD